MGRGPSRHPIPQDRRDPAERPQEELALLRIIRDEFHGGPHSRRDRGEVLDQVVVLDDDQRASVLWARRQLPVLRDGLLPVPVSVRTAELEAGFPETRGDEERLGRPELERMSDLVLPIRGEAAVLFADLLHQPLDEGLLPHQVQAAQDLPRLLDEFPKAVLVRVARVEERGEDSFLEFVMEKISRSELFLRVTRPADEDPLEVREVQERFRHQIPYFLVPLVDRDIVASLEAPRTLASHPVLGRHLRLEILDHFNPLAAQQAEGRLAPVDHDEAVDVLLGEHLVEWRRVEFRVATVKERRDRLRRLEDEGDHFRLVRPDLFVAREDDEPVRRRHPVRLQPLNRGLDRLGDVLSSARALDVRRLRQLGTQVIRHVRDRSAWRDIDADEFRAAARGFFDLLEGASELVFVHPGHFAHWFVLHSYLSFITFCVETASTWRKSSFRSADPSSFPETTTRGISEISPPYCGTFPRA